MDEYAASTEGRSGLLRAVGPMELRRFTGHYECMHLHHYVVIMLNSQEISLSASPYAPSKLSFSHPPVHIVRGLIPQITHIYVEGACIAATHENDAPASARKGGSQSACSPAFLALFMTSVQNKP